MPHNHNYTLMLNRFAAMPHYLFLICATKATLRLVFLCFTFLYIFSELFHTKMELIYMNMVIANSRDCYQEISSSATGAL